MHFETNAEVTENRNLTPHLFNAIYIAFLRLKTHLHEKGNRESFPRVGRERHFDDNSGKNSLNFPHTVKHFMSMIVS